MKIEELLAEHKASAALCRSKRKLGASDQASCVSQGFRPHTSVEPAAKSHTDGKGHHMKGKKKKSELYGGDYPNYDTKYKSHA